MKVVISGVSLTEGGILSILQDCAKSAKKISGEHDFIFLVHQKELMATEDPRFVVKEYPKIKQSWFRRLYFEYIYCKKLSKELKPDVWISLHDMTPNVLATKQFVYCHNPSPFFTARLKDVFIDYKLFLFSFFYKYLYGINIKKNKYVIVQQNWLREAFNAMYDVSTIVAYPSIDLPEILFGTLNAKVDDQPFTFFYPSFPRIFKNFEVLLDATLLLAAQRVDFQVVVTIDASQNKLAEQLFKKYKHCDQIKFIGKQTRDSVYEIFNNCNCLLFPSKLETWGLPLTEAKLFKKPILVADLEYAHENIQDYKNVKFFDPDNPKMLASYMDKQIDGILLFDKNVAKVPLSPFYKDWDNLIQFLITDKR